jgi:metallo-beta-lactamase class B
MKSQLARYILVKLQLFCIMLTTTVFGQQYNPPPVMNEEWIKEYAPFRIAGNLYYVGSYDLACYLITSAQGHVLINTGTVESAAMLRSHVEQLGLRFEDIKILLNSQAHYDHVGAMAVVKAKTGAAMMVNERDAQVVEDGGFSDFIFGGKRMFDPVQVDRRLKNKDTVVIGNTRITVLHHPGHTKGSTSFLLNVGDSSRTYRVLIANMPTILAETRFPAMLKYPEVGKDYAYTFAQMKNLKFDIWLAAHASQFGLHKKRKPGDTYQPSAFIDRAGYEKYLTELESEFKKRSASTSLSR